MTLVIAREDPFSETAAQLANELSLELGARYGEEGGAFVHQPAQFAVERAVFLVARLDGVPVGCGALRPYTAETVEIKRMYVRPAARGQGIARAMLNALEAAARDFGYTRLLLETGTLQPEAIALYEAAGYQRTAPYGNYRDDPLTVCFDKPLV
jgi:GNAT superfamily N-acetyltransferase